MNWKEFLKPNLKKMRLAVLLYEPIAFILILQLVISEKSGFLLGILPYFSDHFTSIFTLFIITVLYSYFLSCLTVWIYEKKFRKVKGK